MEYRKILSLGIGAIVITGIVFSISERVSERNTPRTPIIAQKNNPTPANTATMVRQASGEPSGYQTGVVRVGGVDVTVDLARTSVERSLGLSGRTELTPGTGMLFVFNVPAKNGFWMKDMLFSIDMMWLNGQKEIIHIEKNVSPESYPKNFGPDTPSLYVLEVPAGFSDAYLVRVGDVVTFVRGF